MHKNTRVRQNTGKALALAIKLFANRTIFVMTVYIGVTGTVCSGKGSFTKMLQEKYGSLDFNTSDEVRQVVAERGLTLERENLHFVSNDCRAKFGPDYFAQRCIKKINSLKEQPAVITIDGLRTLGEIASLQNAFGKSFFMVAIEASQKARYERAQSRKRAGEHKQTFEEWQAIDNKEYRLQSSDSNKQNVLACLHACDLVVFNDSTMAAFEQSTVSLINSLLAREKMPLKATLAVGSSGPNGAGKTTFYNLARSEYGALGLSLGDEIRRELLLHGMELSHKNMIELGNEMRRINGEEVLAKRVAERIKRLGNGLYAIDAVYNPVEIDCLREELEKFFSFYIDAPREKRFERLHARGREGDKKISFEAFQKLDEEQQQGSHATGQKLLECKKKADVVMENKLSEEEFKKNCRKELEKIEHKKID